MSTGEANAKWKVLESEYLHREPWLTVKRERVELPNGNQIPSYYILKYPDWINVLAITKDGQFLLIRQYRHGLGETHFELSAGVVEAGEDLEVAARRELLEETGYGGGSWQEYMTLSANSSTHSNLTHTFLATGVEKLSDQNLEDSEDITVHLFSPAQVKAMLVAGEIVQSLMAAPLWKYVAENGM